MKLSGTLEQRLRDWLRDKKVSYKNGVERPFFQILTPSTNAIVRETAKEGEAEVVFAAPSGSTCIEWALNTGLFEFLKECKNVDGAFFVHFGDGWTEAHLVECKRTVDQTRWDDITSQMRWSLCMLMALAGVLGVQVDAVVMYTAYRFDKLSEDESPDPIASKRLISASEEEVPEEQGFNEARRRQLDWQLDQVRLQGFEEVFPHRKILLDPATGKAGSAFAPTRPSNRWSRDVLLEADPTLGQAED